MHGVQILPAAGRPGTATGTGTGTIGIRGARTHNLKDVDVDIPRDRLVVITGLSGSGKSSLAFDTIYAEGQRRYVESLSAYARQFLSVMEKPDVDHIEGLSPAIAIEQRAGSGNPRSTVGTVTEIPDYLRLLFARVGEPRCLDHGVVLESQTVSQMVDAVLARVDAVRQRREGRSRHPLRVILHLRHRCQKRLRSVPRQQGLYLRVPGPHCCQLGVEIPDPLPRLAHVRHQQGHKLPVDRSFLADRDRGDPHPFLELAARVAVEGACHHSAHVRPVRRR